MKRRTERTYAFSLIFQSEFFDELDEAKAFNLYFDNNISSENTDKEFVRMLFFGAMKNRVDIDKIIETYSESWSLNRISKADLAILRLAVFELMYTDTPEKVVANEAVELAKNYSADESGAFVNGIIANVIKQKNSRNE